MQVADYWAVKNRIVFGRGAATAAAAATDVGRYIMLVRRPRLNPFV